MSAPRFASLGRPMPRLRAGVAALGAAAAALASSSAAAQPAGFGAAFGSPSPRAAAPVDLTGYWVSLVTEDWIERMAPDSPPSGSGGGFGRGAGGPPRPATNPDDPCRAYGAGGIMRVPGRVHVSWADDRTLELEFDAGSQRRVLHFEPGAPAPEQKTLQGYSVARWVTGRDGGAGFGGGRGGPAAPPAWGKLEVVTTGMSGGYLLSSRSNYSDAAVLTEYWSYHSAFGNEYVTVTAILDDGGTVSTTSSTFKKEPDGAKFEPTGCEIRR
ncbi:MAG TPA: hypothetical protein VF339_10040 [Gammaproteobacteria bacterium]